MKSLDQLDKEISTLRKEVSDLTAEWENKIIVLNDLIGERDKRTINILLDEKSEDWEGTPYQDAKR